MEIVSTTEGLRNFCNQAANRNFVTVDTEFLRENTYYAKLCLVQLAYQGDGESDAIVVDTLSKKLDLAPLKALFEDQNIVKVFHAARQDLEIFFKELGILPRPFFDTQIAAMVAGYGEQVGYETLVRSLCNGKVDKTNRFTDWSRRPLSEAQLNYARSDVTFLRDVYVRLKDDLEQNGRLAWVQEELDSLVEPSLYQIDPREMWRRIRTRTNRPQFLSIVRELAALREQVAMRKNQPRGRVLKDDSILEIAAQKPKTEAELNKLRMWQKESLKKELALPVIKALKEALNSDPASWPVVEDRAARERPEESVIDLLRVYLKAQAEKHQVASKLICTSAELLAFALAPEDDQPLTRGWRFELFGKNAKKIMAGELYLRVDGKYVETVALD